MTYSVSIIIPCYNSSKYINKTLESIFSQTYKRLEVLAVDDGSLDETKNILSNYGSGLKVTWHEENINRGLGESLNLGVKNTNCELIAFMDHDDIWHPKKIEMQVQAFKENKDIGLCFTNGYVIDSYDKMLYSFYAGGKDHTDSFGNILLTCYIKTMSSVMVKRELLKKVGSFGNYIAACDHDMWIRLSEVGKFYYLNDFLTYWRIHKNQSSKRNSELMWKEDMMILKEAMRRYPYKNELRNKRMAVIRHGLAMSYMKQGKYYNGIKNLIMAGMNDPMRAVKYILRKERE